MTMPAGDRLRLLLNLIPWLEIRGDEGATPAELVDRFGYPKEILLEDLREYVNFVTDDRFGLFDHLVFDIEVADDLIWVKRNTLLQKPLATDSAELANVVARARSVIEFLGIGDEVKDQGASDELAALESAVAKLQVQLAAGADAVQIRLLTDRDRWLDLLDEAVKTGRCVEMEYHSYDRDEETRRVVEPHRCLYDGFWYLTAYCRQAEAPRVFRLDRIRHAELLDEGFDIPEDVTEAMDGIPADGSLPEVTLSLAPSATWVVEQYPHSATEPRDDGGAIVTLPVAAERWLERLLLRLGPAAEVVNAPDGLDDRLRSAAAVRVLARYR